MIGEKKPNDDKIGFGSSFVFSFVCFYVYECFAQHTYLYMMYVHGTLGGQKRASSSLTLKLQAAVDLCVGVGN